MQRIDKLWQSEKLIATYLRGVRASIPGAQMQIELLVRLLRAWRPRLGRVLDLGCGDGVLGRAVLKAFPKASCVFVDFADGMLAAARTHLGATRRAQIVKADFATPAWRACLGPAQRFDAIVSGGAIHHQPDPRKRSLYRELHQMLVPGGVLLNLEHVASLTHGVEAVSDGYFIEHLVAFHAQARSGKTPRQIAQEYFRRPDKQANLLAPVETQCRWLRQIGFRDVDCFYKLFEFALFGGRR